jgi:hypothetical protein
MTLSGSYSFDVFWTPTHVGERPAKSVSITFHRQGELVAAGTGVARILRGKTPILQMDASNNDLSGGATNLTDVTLTLPLVKTLTGTYIAQGVIHSDILSTTYNSGSGNPTAVREIFSLWDMKLVR